MSEISDDELDTMVNIVPSDSGLPMTVWVRPQSNERHGPRVTVCTIPGPRMFPRDTVSVTLSPVRVIPPGGLSASDLRAGAAWLALNEAAIIAFWESRISGIEFARRLQPLPP